MIGPRVLTRRGAGALMLFALVLAITAAWWALALWPLPDEAPLWLARTRLACFGAARNALPDGAGWLALVGQPLLMLGLLVLLACDALREGLAALAAARVGRVVLGAGAIAFLAGLTAAGWRVAGASTKPALAAQPVPPADVYRRLDQSAPPLALVDQHGAAVQLGQFQGRPVLLTFAFAHCETVCPLLVNDVVLARRRLADDSAVALIVTLDPYRDVPTRLPSVAQRWGLEGEERVLSGPIAEVERVLESWDAGAQRDPLTGDVIHPALVYVIDRSGRVAYATAGGADVLVALVRRL